MSSILRDHSDDVQLFIDSLVKYYLYRRILNGKRRTMNGKRRQALKKAVKTVLGEKIATDSNFLNSLLDNPAILGSLEKYCL